jgi:magnesium transporter
VISGNVGRKVRFMERTRLYRNGVLEAEGFPVAEVSERLADRSATVWFDLCRPTEADLGAISEELGLHRLAVEDAMYEHERPKLDRYDSHLFVTAYAVQIGAAGVDTHEVAAFVTDNALVTVRKNERFDIDAVLTRWDANSDLAKHGVSFLLHGLLDYVVDTHFEAVQGLDDQIEGLQDQLFSDRPQPEALQMRTFQFRKGLVLLRRVVLPMREVVNSLLRRDLEVIDDAMVPFFQDVYDHVLRASEWTESLRDLISSVLEANLTIQSNRLNVIVKQVTSWAAIIAVPTAVTGFYGQNVPYPGSGQPIGFWTSTVITVAASLALFWYFRRKDWI